MLSGYDIELHLLAQENARLLAEKLAAIQRMFIRCSSCHKESRLSSWTFVQDYWYERPYSCTGGDTWHTSATNVCDIICPKCGFENYIYNHAQREKIVHLVDDSDFRWNKHKLFAGVKEKYSR